MRRTLLGILTAYIAGVLISEYYPLPDLCFFILVPLLLLFTFLKSLKGRLPLLFALVFLSIGALAHSFSLHQLPKDHLLFLLTPNERSTVLGVIRSFPEETPEKTHFIVEAESSGGMKTTGQVAVTLFPDTSHSGKKAIPLDLQYGDRIRLTGKFSLPRNFRNPGAFDYASFLFRKGIHLTLAASGKNIRVLSRGCGNPFIAWIFRQKQSFHAFVQRHLGEPEAGLLMAMIAGDRSGVGEETRAFFTDAGAAHLLAISGLHIGFVSLFLYTLFVLCLRFALPESMLRESRFWLMPSRLAAMGTFLFLIYYTTFVGGRASTMRAAIMVGLFLLAHIVERRSDLLYTLMVAAMVLLIVRTASLFEVDFQLTFAAVSAMILYAQTIPEEKGETASHLRRLETISFRRRGITVLKKIMAWVAQLAAMTVLAFAATMPLVASTFHRVSAAGLLSNLVLVPLTGFWIVPCGIVTYGLYLLTPSLAIPCLKLTAMGLSLLMKGVFFFGTFPGAARWVFPPSIPFMILFYLAFFALLLIPQLTKNLRISAILILSVLFVLGVSTVGKRKADNSLHMIFFDVGNASSTLLVLPDSKTVLIDGGGAYHSSWDMGTKVLLPSLLTLGINRIDLMILTHPHPDHLNGLVGLLAEIPVGEVWDAWETYPSDLYRRFRQIIAEQRIRRRYVRNKGTSLDLGGVRMEVLSHGPAVGKGPQTSVNNGSIVLKVTYGRVSLLCMADLEAEGEQQLLKRYSGSLRSTILQVGHHGSLTSSTETFLDVVRPEVAVISAGRHNRFHHPATKVLGRLLYMAPRKSLYRTDQDGAIEITTDGKRWWAHTIAEGNFP
jgi:competence protein ComEC